MMRADPASKKFIERVYANSVSFSKLLDEEVIQKLSKKTPAPLVLVELLEHLKKVIIFRIEMLDGDKDTTPFYADAMEHGRKLERELRLDEERLKQIRRSITESVNSVERGKMIIGKIEKLLIQERKS